MYKKTKFSSINEDALLLTDKDNLLQNGKDWHFWMMSEDVMLRTMMKSESLDGVEVS